MIYLLVIAYTLYQFGLFRRSGERVNAALLKRPACCSSSPACSTSPGSSPALRPARVSFVILVLLLAVLIFIRLAISAGEPLTTKEKWLVRLPFSVYYGWVTVATIAGATALLVGYGFTGLGLRDSIWAILVVLAGGAIGIAAALRFRDIPYLLVFIWAYANILFNHVSASGFAGAYQGVILALSLSLAAFVAVFSR